jgi:S-adenosylmethionine hydrolase
MKNSAGPIVLLTDFGTSDVYAGVMKGVILRINPAARIVDLTHGIPPQDVPAGALALLASVDYFPEGSIFVAVVDPGVGTGRRLLCARGGRHLFLAPDNGLLSLVRRREEFSRIVEVADRDWFLPAVSDTFHGRDILAPVAARLSLGMSIDRLGPPVRSIRSAGIALPQLSRSELRGEVLHVDHFGNAVTNLDQATVGAFAGNDLMAARIVAGRRAVRGIRRTYGEVEAGEAVALFGSSGYLEIAVCRGNAARALRLRRGSPVLVRRG